MSLVLDTLLFAALAAAAVWCWQSYKKKRLERAKPVADLTILNLVGITGVLHEKGSDPTSGKIRLRDHDGTERVLLARIEDADEPLDLGGEVLVIQNPTPYAAMVVVPNELPRLEDLPR